MYQVILAGATVSAVAAQTADINKALRLQASILRSRSKWPVGAMACYIAKTNN